MTATIVHVSSVRGDDQLGDGSVECPLATVDRARDVAGYDAIIAYDGLLGTMVPTPPAVESPAKLSPRARLLLIVGVSLALWGLLALLVAASIHNPSLAALIAGVTGVLVAAGWPERDR